MDTTELQTIPGPGLLTAVNGLRQNGFLAYVGELWRTYGDIFQLRLGPRTLIFAMHPEAIRHINIANRQNYDKLSSYDGVRRYLTGEGLIASTGDLWRRQRKLMSPFYTPRSVADYAETMFQDSLRLCARWERLARDGQLLVRSGATSSAALVYAFMKPLSNLLAKFNLYL